MKKYLICVTLMLSYVSPGDAGTWRETFDGQKLTGWTSISKKADKDWKSEWTLENGRLKSEIREIARRGQVVDFLHWSENRINARHLTVVANGSGGPGRGEGGLCLFLGKPGVEPDFAFGYRFCTGGAGFVRFRADGQTKIERKGRGLASFGDRLVITRSELRIIFVMERFQVFSRGVLLTDFKDPEFNRIKVIGLIASAYGPTASRTGYLDTLSISGPDIPNHNLSVNPRGKLATMWGQLKQF